MIAMVFCKRCGHLQIAAFQPTNHCLVCHHIVEPCEYSLEDFNKLSKQEQREYIDQHIIHDDETEYFKDLNSKAAENTIKEWDEAGKRVEQRTSAKPTPHCPICGSADLKKLSTVGKAAKIGIFGIFGMGDVGKTYKCNNCGSKF